MKQKDRIKAIVAIVLVVIIVLSFLIFGKESIVMKYISGGCLVIWLPTMFMLNKKK